MRNKLFALQQRWMFGMQYRFLHRCFFWPCCSSSSMCFMCAKLFALLIRKYLLGMQCWLQIGNELIMFPLPSWMSHLQWDWMSVLCSRLLQKQLCLRFVCRRFEQLFSLLFSNTVHSVFLHFHFERNRCGTNAMRQLFSAEWLHRLHRRNKVQSVFAWVLLKWHQMRCVSFGMSYMLQRHLLPQLSQCLLFRRSYKRHGKREVPQLRRVLWRLPNLWRETKMCHLQSRFLLPWWSIELRVSTLW